MLLAVSLRAFCLMSYCEDTVLEPKEAMRHNMSITHLKKLGRSRRSVLHQNLDLFAAVDKSRDDAWKHSLLEVR